MIKMSELLIYIFSHHRSPDLLLSPFSFQLIAHDDEDGGAASDLEASRRGGCDRKRRERGPYRGNSAARCADGVLPRRTNSHHQEFCGQRFRLHLLFRSRLLQVFGVHERAVRWLLHLLSFIHCYSPPSIHVPSLDSLLPRSGGDIRDTGSRRGGGRDSVSGLRGGRGCDVEQGLRRLRRILSKGEGISGGNVWGCVLLHLAFSHLLLSALQRLQRPRFHLRSCCRRQRSQLMSSTESLPSLCLRNCKSRRAIALQYSCWQFASLFLLLLILVMNIVRKNKMKNI